MTTAEKIHIDASTSIPKFHHKATVFIFVTEGLRLRVLHSDLFRILKQAHRIVIFVPPRDTQLVEREFGGPGVYVEGIPGSRTRWEAGLSFIRRYLLANPTRNRTISVFYSYMKREQPLRYALVRFVNPWLGRMRWLRDLWLALEAKINRGDEYASLFQNYAPSLIVTTDYGSEQQEIRLLRYAQRCGVKTVSIVNSWDNLSSKGVMGCKPERLVVWNEIMRDEAVALHDMRASDVFVCGPAHFDVYARREAFLSREEFCRQMRLDPAKPIIVQGTITPKYYPENVEILQILIAAIKGGRLTRDAQILVRLHPQVVNKGLHADDLSVYRRVEEAHDFVRIDLPETVQWGSMVSPHPAEAKHLAEILYHAAVLVHPGSTLVVDASAVNCPAIGLAFDGYREKPYDESIRRWWDYTYMAPIVRSGGQPIVRSQEELIDAINAFLVNRDHLKAGREMICAQECYRIDGQAGARIAERLQCYLAGKA